MNVRIDHRLGVIDVRYFNKFNMNLKYDSVGSSFAFEFYFDPTNQQHAEAFCVTHFHQAIVQHEGENLINGFIINQKFSLTPQKKLASVSGYSKPGVLENCQIPKSIYPLQTDGMTLFEIAQKLCAPFKIGVVNNTIKANQKIIQTEAKETDTVKSYLAELAKQRGIIISHDVNGDLVLMEPNTDKEPIAIFDLTKKINGTSFDLEFNGQDIHSEITVMYQANSESGDAGEYTIQNPFCPIVNRPKVISITSGDGLTIEQAARQALGAELKNITLNISISDWKINGNIINPGNVIIVQSPDLFLYEKTNWFIEEVDFTGDQEKLECKLKCVPTYCYNTEDVKNFFVDVHENFPRI